MPRIFTLTFQILCREYDGAKVMILNERPNLGRDLSALPSHNEQLAYCPRTKSTGRPCWKTGRFLPVEVIPGGIQAGFVGHDRTRPQRVNKMKAIVNTQQVQSQPTLFRRKASLRTRRRVLLRRSLSLSFSLSTSDCAYNVELEERTKHPANRSSDNRGWQIFVERALSKVQSRK